MIIKKKLSLEILLEQQVLAFNGSPPESAGALLRGSVILNLKEAISFVSLDLQLLGVVYQNWNEVRGNQSILHFSNNALVDRRWELVKPGPKNHTLPAGVHTFDFEYVFNGSLPVTIHLDNGGIEYKLEATLYRGFLRGNTVTRKEIIVRRYPDLFNSELAQAVHLCSEWSNILTYEISLPSRMVGFDENIPVDFKLDRIRSTTQILKVGCYIRENITNHIPKADTNLVEESWIKLSSISPRELQSQSLSLNVRISPRNVHFSCNTKWFTVDHILAFKVKLKDAHLGTRVVSLEVPVLVLSSNTRDVVQSLPPYTFSETPNSPFVQPPPYIENENLVSRAISV
ncbi:hypothetical protein K493DRAFT_375816 [Basidiobolus meristosporus CBS 931.73]|uniref:Arrestin C-terminal-like domain-containing protein n=1 Tax=Basidiobolus meristosporus CBS 931.73 TaxID=1314790 RepID=A0A1Y1Z574_9FUNG|nr:hypothetical protein K493DRAFT_375816 [Basidiobolus meristosporus CBS 931.73]|eukprot:ORY05413.1 hypothetical protein K493DRAFT_375816 [Basidiobolus meristosporus CBS 931.73]